MKFDPVTLATPAFLILIVIEMLWARRKRPAAYEPADTLVSLLMGLGSVVAGMLTGWLVLEVMFAAFELRPLTVSWEWWAWIACFVLDDLAYYWIHRTGHRVRWFWASHVNHHSSQHYNLSTALRQSWTGFIALGFLFRVPLALAGFHPLMIATCVGVNLTYQFWIHTEAIGRMPRWFEAVFNTPGFHRVHHAVNPQYLDRNYAGVFIVWDRLFGTFQPEQEGVRIHYGIVRQLGSFNLLWTAFHEWIGIARDVWTAPWRHKLSYIWRVPGWTHDGSRDTSDAIRQRWLSRQSD
ncbi:sterol desaturase family protein [Novosphingobium sp. TH158]|uniref:sterol desaturase family protein n=1 Tax=Novosphingobium sp. TH158 TaxID=2067455 RepID=UPI000C7CEC54|nr:sterol desaturase family protein [Novosphingobium sp. TH158]PLK27429.1 C-5 sterol desaturase [Novosphingobium sp. TH158]